MSRFVLDCAVSRPVDDQVRRWWEAATTRGWAPATAGYHEGRTASALLLESGSTMAGLTGARAAWFAPDVPSAVQQSAQGLLGRATCVATTATDSLLLREGTQRCAAMAGLPHLVLDVDVGGRVVEEALTGLPGPAVLVTAVGNQEIGTLQADLSAWARRSGSSLILDGSTAYGWVDLPTGWQRLILDPRAWGGVPGAVAVCSMDARRDPPFDNVAAAVVAGLTAQRWLPRAREVRDAVRARAHRVAERVRNRISGVEVRGAGAGDLPHVVSISVLYVDAEALQSRLDARGYAVGSGSACASRSGEPSHVLAAVGGLTSGNLRIGLTPLIDDAVVEGFVDALADEVARMREEMGTEDL